MFRIISIVSFIALSCATSVAFACEPAPNHRVEIQSQDSPECLRIDDAFSYGAAELSIHNDCEEPATIDALQCEGCGDPLQLEPDGRGNYIIESRTLSDGARSSQTLAWVVGDQEGTISTTVGYSDNSDACDGWGDPRSPLCSAAPSGSAPLSPLTVMGFLFCVALLGMRRRARR